MTKYEPLKSVVHRRGPLTKADYSEAIGDLMRARMQDRIAHICCSVCEDTGHTAETCHHNPLLLARRWSEATSVWCCYHCGYTATNDAEAREHFGASDQEPAKCQVVARAIASIPKTVNWLMGSGRTRPGEPLYAIQLIDPESGIAIVETEAEQLADAINAAVEQLNTSHRPEGER